MSAREKTPKKAADKSARKGANRGRATKRRAAKSAAAAEESASKRAKRAKRDKKAKSVDKPKKTGGLNPLEYILPVVSLAIALVGSAMLYRHVFIKPKEAAAAATAAAAAASNAEPVAQTSNTTTYSGVPDPWNAEGYFTTGYKDLDEQVKLFCDAVSVQGNNARQNAQLAYNQIIWSAYEGRTDEQKPTGDGWEIAAARHFFSTGSPKDGIGGSGDYYEYSAATSFCLRYFGFWDAFATPALSIMQESIAVCVVTDENGYGCVCDPTYGVDGWMLNRSVYTVTVEDIGQDLTRAEALGLRVVNSSNPNAQTNAQPNAGASAQNDPNAGNVDDQAMSYGDESYDAYY